MKTVTVTANQYAMLKKIALSFYNGYNGDEPKSIAQIPMHDLVDSNADKGTLTTLKKAGLIQYTTNNDINSNYCNLTQLGFETYKAGN